MALHRFYSECGLQTQKRFKMQNPRPHSRPTESETTLQQHPQGIPMHIKAWEVLSLWLGLITNSDFISYQSPSLSLCSSPTGLFVFLKNSTYNATSVPLHLLCLLPLVNFQYISTWLSCPNSFRTLLNYQWDSPDIKSQHSPWTLHSPRIPTLSALLPSSPKPLSATWHSMSLPVSCSWCAIPL